MDETHTASSHATPRRKLAAILSVDVVGYSRLMIDDEKATLATLLEYRDVMRDHIRVHDGRVVDSPGDALLAEFGSAVEAVAAALEIQRELARRNAPLSEGRRMLVRIGVNLGDVIEQNGALYGDGVNIAARIEGLALPGSVCISRLIYENVKGKMPLTYEYLGKKAVKNIPEPIEVYLVSEISQETSVKRISRRVTRQFWFKPVIALTITLTLVVGALAFLRYGNHTSTPAEKALLAPSDKPSIAVLPFDDLTGDPKRAWFSDGLTETLITELSRLRNLYVIARNSAFTYKGKAVDVRKVAQELGVKYVMEGSVQSSANRVRVNVQLTEAATGRHLWAERYDRPSTDIFDIQDDITRHVVTELDVALLHGEDARVWRRSTRSREAYELYLRARETYDRYTREDIAHAQGLLTRALEVDPNFTMAMVWLGWTHYTQADSAWSANSTVSYERAVELGERAIHMDDTLPDAYAMVGTSLLALRRHSPAMAAFKKALEVGPNSADNLVLVGWGYAQNGKAHEARALIDRGFRLNPYPPPWWYGALGDALLFGGHPGEAILAHRKCVESMPDHIWCQFGLTVDLVQTNRLAEARTQVKEVLRINGTVTAEENTYAASIGDPVERRRIVEILTQVGLR